MTLGGYITLLASVAGLGAVSAVQDPTFEAPTYSPVFAPDQSQDLSSYSQGVVGSKAQATGTWVVQTQKTVSVTFTGASAREVVEWLTKQGVSFMLADSDLPGDRKISMNIVNQPVDSVVNALGTALGGHWERNNGILVFRKGGGFGGLTFAQPGELPAMGTMSKELLRPGSQGLMSSKDWEEFNKSLQQKYRGRSGVYAPGIEFKRFDVQPFLKMSQDQVKQSEELRKQIQKDMEAGKFKRLEGEALSKAQMEKLHELMKMQGADTAAAEKMARELTEKASKGWPTTGQPFMDPKAAEKMSREMKDAFSKAHDWPKGADFAPMIEFGGQDFRGLVKSLTSEQKEKQKRQGFLRYSDLTPAQRRYLGRLRSDGDWTLKYKSRNDEITIKNDR